MCLNGVFVSTQNVHFMMEEPRQPSRFITVKALRILRHYGADIG